MRNGLDTLRPDGLIEFRIESHIVCAHRFACEFDHGFDSPRSTFFERTAVNTLVEVDGVFSGDDILEGRAGLASLGMKCKWKCKIEDERKPTFFFVVVVT
jgi:hypothetical protein